MLTSLLMQNTNRCFKKKKKKFSFSLAQHFFTRFDWWLQAIHPEQRYVEAKGSNKIIFVPVLFSTSDTL